MSEEFAKDPNESEIQEGYAKLAQGSPQGEVPPGECDTEDNRKELLREFEQPTSER